METTVTGVLATPEQAQEVVRQLETSGLPPDAIVEITKDTPDVERVIGHETADVVRGVCYGGLVGLLAGACIGLLLSQLVASFPVPTLAAALLFAVIGAIVGSAVGALVGSATGHQVQEEYEHLLDHGGVLVAVNTDRAHALVAQQVLRAAGASHLSTSVHRHRATSA